MKKTCLLMMLVLFTLNAFAQDAVVAGVKVNQSATKFKNGIVAKKFTKVNENVYKGTFAGYSNSLVEVKNTSDGWVDRITVSIPTDGTYDNGKHIAESLILAYNKKYGSDYNKFERQEFGNFCHQLCTDDICFTIYISQDNKTVGVNYVIMKRDAGINMSDI